MPSPPLRSLALALLVAVAALVLGGGVAPARGDAAITSAAGLCAVAAAAGGRVATAAPVHQTFKPTKRPTGSPVSKSPTSKSPTKGPTFGKCELCENGKPCAKRQRKLQQQETFCNRLINDNKCTGVMWTGKGCPTKCTIKKNCSPMERKFRLDGGCRPKDYCGWTCEARCAEYSGCKWWYGECLPKNKATTKPPTVFRG